MILIDTNVLVAMSSKADSLHDAAMELMTSLPSGQGVLPTVLAEASYLINAAGGISVERQFLQSVRDDFTLVPLEHDDLLRIDELLGEFEGSNIGTTDASIFAVAERLGITQIATFDRRHFNVIVGKYRSVELLPLNVPLQRNASGI